MSGPHARKVSDHSDRIDRAFALLDLSAYFREQIASNTMSGRRWTETCDMNDSDIRKTLKRELATEHAGDPDTYFVDELGMTALAARIDFAVINGELIGFEIKSPRDTLTRLSHQAEMYAKVFDRVTVVSTEKHLRQIEEMVPEWFGLAEIVESNAVHSIRWIRAAALNDDHDPAALATLLWRSEALAALAFHKLDRGVRNKPRRQIWNRLASELSIDELAHTVRNCLKNRSDWRAVQPQTSGDGSCRS